MSDHLQQQQRQQRVFSKATGMATRKVPGSGATLWGSFAELGDALQSAYSVTDLIRQQYVDQVNQYPLYYRAMDRVIDRIDRAGPHLRVAEYGPGPGILAERITHHPDVDLYFAIEPEATFRAMTRDSARGSASEVRIVDSSAETWVCPGSVDLVAATATYHHFEDKPLALANIRTNLRRGGELVLMDVFFRDYAFDAAYQPRSRTEFVERVLECATAQIMAMPRAGRANIIDQLRTAFLDILQIEEMKVCISILLHQLRAAGFLDIHCELMELDTGTVDSETVDSESLGYYFITAQTRGG